MLRVFRGWRTTPTLSLCLILRLLRKWIFRNGSRGRQTPLVLNLVSHLFTTWARDTITTHALHNPSIHSHSRISRHCLKWIRRPNYFRQTRPQLSYPTVRHSIRCCILISRSCSRLWIANITSSFHVRKKVVSYQTSDEDNIFLKRKRHCSQTGPTRIVLSHVEVSPVDGHNFQINTHSVHG